MEQLPYSTLVPGEIALGVTKVIQLLYRITSIQPYHLPQKNRGLQIPTILFLPVFLVLGGILQVNPVFKMLWALKFIKVYYLRQM